MIAAVNGVCAGGGLHFVADADIVIASSDATFLDPHVSVGQVTAYETIALVRKSPMEAICRMAFIGPARAHDGRAGAAARHPVRGRRAGGLRDRAHELAETVARNSPAAMAATKRALWGALELGLTDACRAGAQELIVDVGPSRPDGRTRRVGGEARASMGDYQHLIVERARPGRLAHQQPA